jgi:hypothetical protein
LEVLQIPPETYENVEVPMRGSKGKEPAGLEEKSSRERQTHLFFEPIECAVAGEIRHHHQGPAEKRCEKSLTAVD